MHRDSTVGENSAYTEIEIEKAVKHARLLLVAFVVGAGIFAVIVLVVLSVGGPMAPGPMANVIAGVSVIPAMSLIFLYKPITRRSANEILGTVEGMDRTAGLVYGAIMVGAILEGSTLMSIIAGLFGGAAYLILSLVFIALQVVHVLYVPDLVRKAGGLGGLHERV